MWKELDKRKQEDGMKAKGDDPMVEGSTLVFLRQIEDTKMVRLKWLHLERRVPASRILTRSLPAKDSRRTA